MDRDKVIIKVSIQGIIVNVILVLFKAFVGVVANSIAIILDAVNNLSDAVSQVVTIVGTKLSSKDPDAEHPYGYGRIEYLSSVIVAAFVLVAGLTSLKESFLKTLHPDTANYSIASLVIIGVGVVVKFVFGRYVKGMGEKVSSQSLIASGTDAFMDSILSFSTFVAAIISRYAHVTLEGILGVVLSVFIIKAGYDILMETLNSIIGSRIDKDFSVQLKQEIAAYEGVNGAYDLVLHDYGPSRSIGSVHIEVDDALTAYEIYSLTRMISADMYLKYRIAMTVGIYASNTSDPLMAEIKEKVQEIISGHENILQMHGFYVNKEKKIIYFDLVISYDEKNMQGLRDQVVEAVKGDYPEFTCYAAIDHDFSD